MIRTASMALLMLMLWVMSVQAQTDSQVTAGINALKNGAYEEAIQSLSKALETPARLKKEDATQAHFYRGMAIISAHQEALRLRRSSPVSEPYLKTCEDLMAALRTDNGRWADDIKQLQKELFRPLLAEGTRSLNGNQYEQAFLYMDCVVNIRSSAMDDDYWPAYDMRGQARLALQDTVKALEDLQKAGEVYQRATGGTPDPLIAYVYYRAALIHRFSNRDVDQALEAIRQGKTVLEAERLKFSNELRTESLDHRFAQAQNDLDRFELEILLQKPDKYDEAIAHFKQAVAENPDDYTLLMAYAALVEARDTDAAVPIYERAISIAPDRSTAYFNLAVMYYNEGADLYQKIKDMPVTRQRKETESRIEARFLAAIPAFEKARELEPNDDATVDALLQIVKYLKRDDEIQKYTRIKQQMEGR